MSEKSLAAAKVVDGVLVISLPDAETPVVWQMELGQSKSSAMEVRTLSDNNFQLMLKTSLHDVQPIASYTSKDLAVQALLTISRALENAQGQINPDFVYNPASLPVTLPSSQKGLSASKFLCFLVRCLKWIAGFVILYIVIGFLASHLINGDKKSGGVVGSSSSQQNVPLSADDFLEGR